MIKRFNVVSNKKKHTTTTGERHFFGDFFDVSSLRMGSHSCSTLSMKLVFIVAFSFSKSGVGSTCINIFKAPNRLYTK